MQRVGSFKSVGGKRVMGCRGWEVSSLWVVKGCWGAEGGKFEVCGW